MAAQNKFKTNESLPKASFYNRNLAEQNKSTIR